MPFFAVGFVVWTLISGFLSEACTALTQFEGLIKQRRCDFFIFVLRIYVRHLFIFIHNLCIVFLVLLLVGDGIGLLSIAALLGLFVVSLDIIFMGVCIAILCTRFRDMPPIVISVLQIIFFATPILWDPSNIKRFKVAVDFNPFMAMVSLVRKPMLGHWASVTDFMVALLIVVFFAILSAALLGRYRRRIAYWL
jgi:lipopolysaccharide transport system permease protein